MSWSGRELGGRFEVGEPVAQGGMGAVYRARDRSTGSHVAVKVLLETAVDEHRFVREAQMLESIVHPGIVRHVAHGRDPEQGAYLVLEWVDGEPLSSRLERGPLALSESVRLIRQVAAAAGAAHAVGVVHRDLKPSNVMLRQGDVGRPVLIDFGATLRAGGVSTTRPSLVGTPGYMPPEQARGSGEIDARADVFALGALLFECITGAPPFEGQSALSRLAKTVLADAPLLGELLPAAPPSLGELVRRMLSRDPADRPADAGEVARALERFEDDLALERLEDDLAGGGSEHLKPERFARSERAVLTLVFGSSAAAPLPLERVQAIGVRHSGNVELLADGSVFLHFSGATAPTEQATRVARCALELAAALPDARFSVATGIGSVDRGLAVGDIVDAAGRLLHRVGVAGVVVDEVTAGLLTTRFEVDSVDGYSLLVGETRREAKPRRLLGRPTPTVGRDAELSALRAMVEDVFFEHGGAQVALVSGPAGIGKSRVRHELTDHLAGLEPRPREWLGRGDPARIGSPFGVAASALRAACDLRDGEPLGAQRDKLRAFVGPLTTGENRERILEFVGELCGVRAADVESIQLRAARQDASLMFDQIERAWVEVLAAMSQDAGIVLVIEDLHWGDLGSVKLVEAALKNLDDAALLVVAFARPDVTDRFPGLWARRGVVELRLGPLASGAAERVVRSVLGNDVSSTRVREIVDRAGGNPFFLEEIIRSEASGEQVDLPHSVLSVLQSRLSRMEPEARLVTRAASIFGNSFWPAGVGALLAGTQLSEDVASWLMALEEREVVTPRPQSRLAGEVEYVFRHALVRDAAYALLADNDRRLGHRLAGEWLEGRGALDALMLAEHFERGEVHSRARHWWRRAAESALAATDLETARRHADRALRHAPAEHERGALELLIGETWHWSGTHAEAVAPCERALELLPRGSSAWSEAAVILTEALGSLGRVDDVRQVADRLLSVKSGGDRAAMAMACARMTTDLRRVGANADADRLLEQVDVDAIPVDEPRRRAFVHRLYAHEAFHKSEFGAQLSEFESAIRCFELAGDQRWAARDQANLAYGYALVGMLAEAERLLRSAATTATRLGLDFLAQVSAHNLGLVLARQGRLDEARRLEVEATQFFVDRGSQRLAGFGYVYLARIELWAGEPEAARAAAARARAIFAAGAPQIEPYAIAAASAAALAGGNSAEAAAFARTAMTLMAERGRADEGETFVRAVHAEALAADGDRDGARESIAVARRDLLDRAARLPAELREAFLQKIEENALTLRLAREWAAPD